MAAGADALLGRPGAGQAGSLGQPQKGAVDGAAEAVENVEVEEPGGGAAFFQCQAAHLGEEGGGSQQEEGVMAGRILPPLKLHQAREGAFEAVASPAEEFRASGRGFPLPRDVQGEGQDRRCPDRKGPEQGPVAAVPGFEKLIPERDEQHR